jgi:hypothetical protein
MADPEARRKQGILEWVSRKLFPEPIAGAARESTAARQRVEGQNISKMEQAAGIEEVPKAEGKSTGEKRDMPRQKYYK